MLRFNNLVMFLGFLILLGICLYLRRVKGKDYGYLTLFSIFFVYITYVLRYTLFPIPLFVEQSFQFNYNLVPFRLDPHTRLLGREVLLNILLSVPFGFGISFLRRVNWRQALLFGIGFGLVVEVTQLFISLGIGFAYRVFDVNDLVFNFTGVVLGYSGFLLFSLVLEQLLRRFATLRTSTVIRLLPSPVQEKVRELSS